MNNIEPGTERGSLWRQGLLHNNPGLIQLLGLCPLLAISNTLVNAIGLGIATLLTVTLTNTLVSLLRPLLFYEIRIPVFVLIIAGLVTIIERLMEAWMFDLYQTLGIFVPLIVTNCLILARAEAFASRQRLPAAFIDGLAMGSGFLLALVLLGALRELLGHGSLFAGSQLLLGANSPDLTLQLTPEHYQFLLFSLPPGAFLLLGLLVAMFRWRLSAKAGNLPTKDEQPIDAMANNELTNNQLVRPVDDQSVTDTRE